MCCMCLKLPFLNGYYIQHHPFQIRMPVLILWSYHFMLYTYNPMQIHHINQMSGCTGRLDMFFKPFCTVQGAEPHWCVYPVLQLCINEGGGECCRSNWTWGHNLTEANITVAICLHLYFITNFPFPLTL